MKTKTFIFSNFVNDKIKIYVQAVTLEQAKEILSFTVIEPENYKFEIELK